MTISEEDDGLRIKTVREDNTKIQFTESLTTQSVDRWLPSEAFVVVDEAITKLHPDWVEEIRNSAKGVLTMKGGDEHKNLEAVQNIVDGCVDAKISRRGTLVGLGGGVTTDTTGLAAALYYRGVNAEYVPTTLLAMIDASIGGKVGVNHPSHKNLIGSFYQPNSVTVDPQFMQTQEREQILSGLGEVLKIALISSRELFEILRSEDDVTTLMRKHARKMIRICIEKKIKMLGSNCYERSFERKLNFGHSVAHPLEDVTQFRIPHGIAVGMGIGVASHIAKERGVFPSCKFDDVTKTMQKLGLPLFDADVDEEEVWKHIEALVLQRGGKKLYYVIPERDIGNATIIDSIEKREFLSAVEKLRALQKLT